MFVVRRCRFLSRHNGMWKAQCDITEKMALLPPNPRLPWEFMYLGNPHVPRDFDKIQDAINNACEYPECCAATTACDSQICPNVI